MIQAQELRDLSGNSLDIKSIVQVDSGAFDSEPEISCSFSSQQFFFVADFLDDIKSPQFHSGF